MWKEPEPDPGGEASQPKTSRELRDLQDQNEQQQVLIAQLKEMLRKEQSTVPQEKVEEYINTLSKAKAKRSRLKKDESGSVEKISSVDSRKSGKVNLLKQQLEENKAKLAERGMRQKDIEEMVSAIKTELNDSQQMFNATPVNLPSLEINLEYNKSTSPEELYNILLVKERKITDLLEKTQKQEGTILDLQENLKEKDQVIDARTKAITLMTDNLSKKGKDTLDALDDTKEQMRKMQENFITLESEMKARQMILLNDLKAKNVEITELQEQNEKLAEEKNEILKNSNLTEKSEVDNHEVIIKDLQQKLTDSKTKIEEYTSKINDLELKLQETQEHMDLSQNSEVEKLKKQLEESNKNMIKVKAQNKSKVKELNKKLDGFKKMSDSNAMIIQLQNEITKLNENIAELEEEKGNMQLKMVESIESLKGSTNTEDIKELQEKLETKSEELDEKDKIISLLESDIISLKSEITNLNEKNFSLSELQNKQVSSEITSIQIEEQLENLQSDNNKLREEIDTLRKEKEELLEKIEEFNKEKMDLTTKLDNYIQENMELIDKLEKLSAEKVSSAESIEIVESLTQQEKLELAAYQKNMETNLEEPVKTQEEEPAAELNESVLQLTEDSAELLNRIEMFNVERKEVMIKLEALREENNQLSLKLNEIENNRDILAETYEQVQTEKDDLQKENEELTQQIKELRDGKSTNQDVEYDLQASSKLQDLQKEYEKLFEENNTLKQSLKQLDTKIHEKDNLEGELNESRTRITELESKLTNNLEEITNYQAIIEDNKTEFINSSNIINKLQSQLSERERDIEELNVLINDLNNIVNDLQTANNKLGNFEEMEKQIDELKRSLNEQVEYAQAQAEEFKEELEFSKTETQKQIEEKNRENGILSKELIHKEEIINGLQEQLQEKDSKVHEIIEEMKQKYLGLQKQLDSNSGSLEKQVQDLSNKNKEQLEKMKKIAANLKKKTQAYQELEKKYNGEKEKWETEVNKKESGMTEVTKLQSEIEAIKQELDSKLTILENTESRVKELTDVVDTLQQQNVDLQNMLLEAKQKQEKVSEVSLKQELSTSLHEEFDNQHGSNESTNEDKINELQLIIETNESELYHYKERSQKLEEDLAVLLEEKDSLLVKSKDLAEQLNLMSRNIEEKNLLEQEMGQKLQEVAANDDALSRRLEELQAENKELTERNREQEELVTKLKIKIKKAQEKVNQLKILQSTLEEHENMNSELKKQIAYLEATQKQAHIENEELQKQNQRDYERIEADYQMQLEGLLKSRNELTFECEKLEETVKSLKDREEELVHENNEYKQKLEVAENEYSIQVTKLTDNLNSTSSNWQISIQKIETLEKELENLQKQIITDTAKETVENVLTQAKEKIIDYNTKETQTEEQSRDNPSQIINLDAPGFQWGDQPQQGSWFDESESPASIPQQTDVTVTKEDLENKIKALEILLYNADNEKEAVVKECSDMLNELTRLVYEKVNTQNIPSFATPLQVNLPSASDLESQIMSAEEIDASQDPQKLQQLEFERTGPCLGHQPEPVVDIMPQPTSAYLTYQPEPQTELEAQIMSSEAIQALNDPVQLQQLEFEASNPCLGQQSFPVVEKLAQPSKAYLTYQVSEAIGENDDGWGWGPEEARLEEEHQYRTENIPQVQALRKELDELRLKMQVLQTEKEAHLEEIKQLQIKSGKLMKKCKELKLQNDKLAKKSNEDDFFDLNQSILEELKAQINTLEGNIKDTTAKLQKEKQEKAEIAQKIETLKIANEDLKQVNETQKSELLKLRRREEQEKIETDSWYDYDKNKDSAPSVSKSEDTTETDDVEELKKLVKDLTVDNEELQALLDDQKQQRVQLERSKSIGSETRINNLEEELIHKETEIKIIIDDKNRIQKELDERNGVIKTLEEELKKVQNEETRDALISDLQKVAAETNTAITALEEKMVQEVGSRDQTIASIQEELRSKAITIQNLQEHLQQLQNINVDLQNSLLEKAKEMENNTKLEEVKTLLLEKTALAEQFQYSNDTLNQQIQTVNYELEHLKNEFNILEANSTDIIKTLQGQLEQKQQEKPLDEYDPAIQEVTQNRAKNVKELVVLFNQEHEEYEVLKLKYEEAVQLNVNYSENIRELNKELILQKEQYQNLQTLSSKNVLDLQSELEESKQKIDELQFEEFSKFDDINRELEETRRKYTELQFERDIQVSAGQNLDEKVQELAQLHAALNEKDLNIKELKTAIEDLQNQKGDLEGEIKQLKDGLNEKQVELDKIVAEMEIKLAGTVSDLEEKWSAQVDERGNTVAESWKYHLNMVESDFAALQEKLKNEINELEEKCNALVNENNELRKNVDTEIKNEVDRISALQQQITDRQRSINELNQLLASEQMEKASLAQQVVETEKIQQLLADKEVELASLKTLAETTRQQFDEKREVVEEIVKILENNTSFPLSCEKQDILNEIQRQLIQSSEKSQHVNAQLENLNSQLNNYYSALNEKEAEILRLKEETSQLHTYYNTIQEKDLEIVKLNENNSTLQSQINHASEEVKNKLNELENKHGEIIQLQQMLEEYKLKASTTQTEFQNAQQKLNETNLTIEDYKQKLEELQQSQISLRTTIEDKNQQISNLNQQLQFATNNREAQNLESELTQYKTDYVNLQQSLAECQQQLFNITQDLATKSHEFETVKQQLAYSLQNGEVLQGEVNRLNEMLHIKEQEYTISLENIEKTHYKELESHYEEITAAKDLDIQTLRAQVAESVYNANEQSRIRAELENHVKQLEEQILEYARAKKELEDKVQELEENAAEQTTLNEEETKQLDEMRAIIEEQVGKIEELKKELFQKSNDYDSLIAEMDISRSAITQQPVSSASRVDSQSAPPPQHEPIPEDDLSEPVNRAELDLALYMLHQRDVRCEELTVELTHLLEERDTLQLRLSNAIREKEELRRKYAVGSGSPEQSTSTSADPGTPRNSRTSEIFLAATGTELASELTENMPIEQDLASKLSELKQVGYKKDKTFVDEQERRRLQQISIMQQHIKEASKLPPEAAAKLVDASYTLSRDVQSPSKVLLNWLWGRSTPKVNDT